MVPGQFDQYEINKTYNFVVRHIKKNSHVVKGEIKGNPFIFYQDIVMNIGYEIEDEFDGDRAGHLAGQVNEIDFDKTNLLLSAVVVTKSDMRPGKGFFNLAKELGLLKKKGRINLDGIEELSFWKDHVKEVIEYYNP